MPKISAKQLFPLRRTPRLLLDVFLVCALSENLSGRLPKPELYWGRGTEGAYRYTGAYIHDQELVVTYEIGYLDDGRVPSPFSDYAGWSSIDLPNLFWFPITAVTDQASRQSNQFSFREGIPPDSLVGREEKISLLNLDGIPATSTLPEVLSEAAREDRLSAVAIGGTFFILSKVSSQDGRRSYQFAEIRSPTRIYARWWSVPANVVMYPFVVPLTMIGGAAQALLMIVFGPG
jgi:hypothetical protein